MAELVKIKFDASIHEDCIGIGIHNFDMKTDIKHRIKLVNVPCSSTAETIALIKTLQYMRQVGIQSAHLFTDNQYVAKQGIDKCLLKGFKSVTLNWIPREFNEEADRLSKEAHQLKPKCYNAIIERVSKSKKATQTQQPKANKKKKAKKVGNKVPTLTKRLRQFTPEQRIKLLKKVRQQSDFTENLIEVLEGKSNELRHDDYRRDDRAFLSIVLGAFEHNELPKSKSWKTLITKTSIKVPVNQHLQSLLKENVA